MVSSLRILYANFTVCKSRQIFMNIYFFPNLVWAKKSDLLCIFPPVRALCHGTYISPSTSTVPWYVSPSTVPWYIFPQCCTMVIPMTVWHVLVCYVKDNRERKSKKRNQHLHFHNNFNNRFQTLGLLRLWNFWPSTWLARKLAGMKSNKFGIQA